MRLRNTLLLAVVFLLLGAYVYFFELSKGGREEVEKLLEFQESEVKEISFSYPEENVRIAQGPSGKWKITEPLQAAADESTIQGILSSLKTGEIKRTIEKSPGPEDIKAFGLDRPAIKVSVTLQDGRTLTPILLGGKTPVGNSTYVRRETKAPVLLADASLLTSLKKTLYDFRDKKIIEIKDDAVERLTLKGERGEFVLAKKDKDWFIEEPRPYRADQSEIQGMLSTIRNMSAREFIEEPHSDMEKYGLDKPRLRVTFSVGENGEQREILFGNRKKGKEEVYLALDSKETLYAVYESVFNELDKNLTDLRDKVLLRFPRERVAKIRIDSGRKSWVLAKEDDEWKMVRPKKGVAKQSAVANYLLTLAGLRAKGFPDDEPKNLKKYGLSAPSFKISLEAGDREKLGTLLLGSKTGKDYYAKLQERPAIYTIRESYYNRLNKPLTEFLEEQKHEEKPGGKTGS